MLIFDIFYKEYRKKYFLIIQVLRRRYCLMEQKIDNIYRTYKDNDRIDDVLFEAYEFILSKLDDELLEDV